MKPIYVAGEISSEIRNKFMSEFWKLVSDVERSYGTKIENINPVRTFSSISDDKYEFRIAFDILCSKEAKEEFNKEMRHLVRRYNKKGLKEVSEEEYFKE